MVLNFCFEFNLDENAKNRIPAPWKPFYRREIFMSCHIPVPENQYYVIIFEIVQLSPKIGCKIRMLLYLMQLWTAIGTLDFANNMRNRQFSRRRPA